MKRILTKKTWYFLCALLWAAAGSLPAQEQNRAGAPALRNPRDYIAYLVGHAHIDLSWLWRWEETVNDVAVRTFEGTLARMEKVPRLTFAQSQAALYEAMEKSYPEIFDRIRGKVREGTWVPVGGMWVEPDLNMPDGESLARQLLYGKRYFLDKFGVDVTVGWNPDAFGHSWQLPQILAKAGVPFYVFERCAPDKTPFFLWEGRDGSRLLAHVPQGWYLVSLKNGLSDVIREAASETTLKDFLILYGEGDHGGGPRDSDLAAIEKYKNSPDQPRMIFATPAAFFKKIEEARADMPVVQRELNFTFPACYTTQAETKRSNRASEALLLEAERLSALAVAAGFRDYYPERDIDEAWKIVLRNQFHDILDGSSIGPVYDDVARFYREARARAQRALDFSLETIFGNVETRGEGVPLEVFNPLFWERTEAATAEVALPFAPATLRILSPSGETVPVQVLERTPGPTETRFRVVFLAQNVPSFGYRVYRAVAVEREGQAEKTALVVSPKGIENEFLKLGVDEKTGWITSLFDKRTQKEMLARPANLQSILDEPESMSAWELGLKGEPLDLGQSGATVQVVESGPVRGVIRVTTPFGNSVFIQDLIVAAGVARLDCRMSMNWQERNLMIKAAFPVNLKSGQAAFEIPFGSLTRPADGAEVPALRWIDLSDPTAGAGLSLLNDGKYGFDVKGTVMRMSVIHGATYPDPEADRGSHEFLYSLYPHPGTWREADTVRRGYELNVPLLVRTGMAHAGRLPAERAFIRVSPSNVVLSTLKMESGYNSRSLIIRLYETCGRKGEARISFPWPVTADETDLIERPVRDPSLFQSSGPANEIAVPMRAWEIKTIRVSRRP
jgi:alpha-mannosidase